MSSSTTDRLLAVADRIEFEPERFSMHTWNTSNDLAGPQANAGREPECGTTCCVAGWAVALTPRREVAVGASWSEAGAAALGLDYELASLLFMETGVDDAASMAACLRRLAKVPEGDRVCSDPGVDEALAEINCQVVREQDIDGSPYWMIGGLGD